MKQKPNLSFWALWNLSFGFFGVQIAYALQSANISRIFRTLGADPHSLSFFWILPPLMGILVQPIVGTLSDKTWCRFGRRIPYLFIGAAVAVAVMCLLPNAGSLVQDARRRHGERGTEGEGIQHPVVPLQCGKRGRIPLPLCLHMDWIAEHSS